MTINFSKYLVAGLLFTMFSCSTESAKKTAPEDAVLFPTGTKNTNDNFKGDVWVHGLVDADSSNQAAVGNVTFAPGARSRWHIHPGGQILLATDGVGYYQEQGQPKLILRKGDVVKCPANIPHWHGASADTAFVQIAITDRANGPTEWLEHVTDEEYHAD